MIDICKRAEEEKKRTLFEKSTVKPRLIKRFEPKR